MSECALPMGHRFLRAVEIRPAKGSQLFASSSPIAARVAPIASSGGGIVGVEVLQAKDVGIVSRGRGDTIDAETRDVVDARNAHQFLALSLRASVPATAKCVLVVRVLQRLLVRDMRFQRTIDACAVLPRALTKRSASCATSLCASASSTLVL